MNDAAKNILSEIEDLEARIAELERGRKRKVAKFWLAFTTAITAISVVLIIGV